MRRTLELAAAVGIAAAAALIVVMLPNPYHLRLLFMISVYALCGLGMNVLVGYTGQKSLGQAGLFAAGAYSAALLTSQSGWGPWASFGGAIVISAACGLVIALPALRAKGPYLAMVTLAFGIVVERTVSEWTEVFGGPQGIFGIQPLTWDGKPFTEQHWAWFGIVLCLLVHLVLHNMLGGRHGRALKSLQIDELAAASSGVGVYSYKVLAFCIAAVTCGMAGAMVAQQAQYINSDYVNFHLSIFILLVVLLGGSGTALGPIVGAVVLVLVDAFLAQWPTVQHLTFGLLLLFGLYVMPDGIAGTLRKRLKAEVTEEEARAEADPALPVHSGGSVSDQVLLNVANLSKSYGGVKPAQDIAMTIQKGEVHALIGPNGAGKSTLVNILTGVVKPDGGTIAFNGKPLANVLPAVRCRAGIARTFQNLRLFGEMSVLENVLLGQHSRMSNGLPASMLNLPSAVRQEAMAREVATGILKSLDLNRHAHRAAGSLPYGVQRRVELARALATMPSLLLLDEPAAGLNPQETRELGRMLLRIRSQGVTILMVEHHMELVMEISDHITVLDHGVRIADGPPLEVRRNAAVIEAYLGKESGDAELDEVETADAVH